MENTLEVATEGGHKIVLKSQISFGEKRSINDAFNVAAIYENGVKTDKSMQAQLNASTDKAIEIIVVSIDGKTTDIVSEFMKLPNRDGLAVIEKISEITDNKKKEPATPKI
jgi:hypothetical protein